MITPADADPDTPEHEIDLGPSVFFIQIAVTAPDNTSTLNYRVRVSDERLRSLSVSHLKIELGEGRSDYTVVVPEEVTEVRLDHGTPFNGSHVSYDQRDQSHSIPGRQVTLQPGVTNVVVTAWSKRERTSQVYNLAIDRAAPAAAANAKLSALQLSEGTAISFDPLVFWYWVNDVGDSVESLTLTAAAAQTGATVVIDPLDADPDLEGHQIAFTDPNMRVTVTVTSSDGSATRTYTVSLHRRLEWADFELGWAHGCGLRSDGRIICGGIYDGHGIYDSGSSHVPSAPDYYVYRDVHAGKHESCGTLVNNTLHCWSGGRSYLPDWGVKQLAYFSWGPNCWLLSDDGTVHCRSGQVPEQVRDQSHQEVAVGATFACVLNADSAIVCWNWANDIFPTPAGEFKHVAAGGKSLICGIKADDDSLLCWTYGDWTRLGNQMPTGQYEFVMEDSSHRYVSADATYMQGYCALRESGGIVCELNVGRRYTFNVYLWARPAGAAFVHVSLGYTPGTAHACGLTNQGRIQCETRTYYPALTNPVWLLD